MHCFSFAPELTSHSWDLLLLLLLLILLILILLPPSFPCLTLTVKIWSLTWMSPFSSTPSFWPNNFTRLKITFPLSRQQPAMYQTNISSSSTSCSNSESWRSVRKVFDHPTTLPGRVFLSSLSSLVLLLLSITWNKSLGNVTSKMVTWLI